MKKAFALTALICALATIGTGSLSAAARAKKFAPHQEPRGIGNLVTRSDHITLVYDAGVKSATGSVYVRNDLTHKFVRLPLASERGPASTFKARVPGRLLRGHRLVYYAGSARSEDPADGTSPRSRDVVRADPRASSRRRSRQASLRRDAVARRGRRPGTARPGRLAAAAAGPGPQGRSPIVRDRGGPLDLPPRQL